MSKKIIIFLLAFVLVTPTAGAFNFSFPNFPNKHEFQKERLAKVLERLCAIRIRINQKHPRFKIPQICKAKEIKPPTLEFYSEPLSITEGESATLSWASGHALSCEASGGWQGEKTLSGTESVSPLVDTTYTISCDGVEDGIEKSVTVKVVPLPPPPPTIDHLIISEVYYDVDGAHGTEPANEWIEIYNGTGAEIDVSGWGVYDGGTSGSDSIPAGTIIPNNSFLLITGSSTTASNWPGKTFVVLRSMIGGGLANGGDAVLIKNLASSTIDSMSYGSNASVFTLSLPSGGTDGHSFGRVNLTSDTDTASDWQDLATPTPGTF